jgi:hypothetical protein
MTAESQATEQSVSSSRTSFSNLAGKPPMHAAPAKRVTYAAQLSASSVGTENSTIGVELGERASGSSFAADNPMRTSSAKSIRRTLSGKGGDPKISAPTLVARHSATGLITSNHHGGTAVKFDEIVGESSAGEGMSTATFLTATRSRIMSINSRRYDSRQPDGDEDELTWLLIHDSPAWNIWRKVSRERSEAQDRARGAVRGIGREESATSFS